MQMEIQQLHNQLRDANPAFENGRERVCDREKACVYVGERVYVREKKCVCVRERARVCV